jgi:hypothetical protein
MLTGTGWLAGKVLAIQVAGNRRLRRIADIESKVDAGQKRRRRRSRELYSSFCSRRRQRSV